MRRFQRERQAVVDRRSRPGRSVATACGIEGGLVGIVRAGWEVEHHEVGGTAWGERCRHRRSKPSAQAPSTVAIVERLGAGRQAAVDERAALGRAPRDQGSTPGCRCRAPRGCRPRGTRSSGGSAPDSSRVVRGQMTTASRSRCRASRASAASSRNVPCTTMPRGPRARSEIQSAAGQQPRRRRRATRRGRRAASRKRPAAGGDEFRLGRALREMHRHGQPAASRRLAEHAGGRAERPRSRGRAATCRRPRRADAVGRDRGRTAVSDAAAAASRARAPSRNTRTRGPIAASRRRRAQSRSRRRTSRRPPPTLRGR